MKSSPHRQTPQPICFSFQAFPRINHPQLWGWNCRRGTRKFGCSESSEKTFYTLFTSHASFHRLQLCVGVVFFVRRPILFFCFYEGWIDFHQSSIYEEIARPPPPPPFKSHSRTTCKPGSGGKLRKHGWGAYEIAASDRLKPRLPAFIPSLREFSPLLFLERQKKKQRCRLLPMSQSGRVSAQRPFLYTLPVLFCFVLLWGFFFKLSCLRPEAYTGRKV